MLHVVTREGGRRVSLTVLNHLRVQRERSEVTLLMRSLARRTEKPLPLHVLPAEPVQNKCRETGEAISGGPVVGFVAVQRPIARSSIVSP